MVDDPGLKILLNFTKFRTNFVAFSRYDVRQPLLDQIDVTYVRGCEIEGMLDEDGRVIEEWRKFSTI